MNWFRVVKNMRVFRSSTILFCCTWGGSTTLTITLAISMRMRECWLWELALSSWGLKRTIKNYPIPWQFSRKSMKISWRRLIRSKKHLNTWLWFVSRSKSLSGLPKKSPKMPPRTFGSARSAKKSSKHANSLPNITSLVTKKSSWR